MVRAVEEKIVDLALTTIIRKNPLGLRVLWLFLESSKEL
jgi:hypothetical protein